MSKVVSCVTGADVRMSPSSFLTHEDCELKWWYNKIQGSPTPTTKSQQLGTDVHAVLEKYLITGENPDQETEIGRIAASGVHLLPDPASYEVEKVVETICGVLPFKGIVDAFHGTHILDHKTTKDFRWALTSHQLAVAPQPLAYIAALQREGLLEKTNQYLVSFVYYRTKGTPLAHRVDATVDWGHVESNWDDMCETAEAMKTLADVADPLVPSFNLQSCGKYGGCPFRSTCVRAGSNSNKKQTTLNLNKEKNMTTQQEKLASFLREDSPVSSPDSAPSATPTGEQFEEALEFARKADENSGKLDETVLGAICKRFQLPLGFSYKLQERLYGTPAKESIEVKNFENLLLSMACDEDASGDEDASIRVYVDCMPDTGVDITLDQLTGPMEAEVAVEHNVPYYGLIGFGKGKEGVASRLALKLLKDGADFQSIFVSLRHPVAGPAIGILSNIPGALVIRGVR